MFFIAVLLQKLMVARLNVCCYVQKLLNENWEIFFLLFLLLLYFVKTYFWHPSKQQQR